MIHVLIERHIAEDMESTYEHAAKNTLHQAYQAVGFINGETFCNTQDSKHRYVLSKWRSIQDWKRWLHSDARREMMSEVNLILKAPEKVTILENS